MLKTQHQINPGFISASSIMSSSAASNNSKQQQRQNKKQLKAAIKGVASEQTKSDNIGGVLLNDNNHNVILYGQEKQKLLEKSPEDHANNDDEAGQPDSTNDVKQRRRTRHLASSTSNKDQETSQADRNEENHTRDCISIDGSKEDKKEAEEKEAKEFKAELVWTNIILFVILHSSLPIGVYMIYSQRPWKTLLFSLLGIYASGLGVTGGSHRLWSHKSYKAKWPVQVILVILQTMAGQNSIYTWSRDHRVHHKFSETDADPHNIKRGFFFAHMGWLCCKKHPDVKEKGKLIDMSDLAANPFVMFQHRHFWWMAALFTVLVPTMIPVLLWQERFWTSFVFSFMIRYLITLHGTWLVNSAAHYYGDRPYDERIEARESPYVIYNGLGEGFHNYHHTFPYDYAAGEFGKYLNITTTFIDFCAMLGLVVDRRTAERETVFKRRLRTGQKEKRASSAGEQESHEGSSELISNGGRRLLAKSIDEADELLAEGGAQVVPNNSPLSPLNNIIHELPYISGLMSMKYTM